MRLPAEQLKSFLGPSPSPDQIKQASSVTYISKDDRPFLIMHGDKDTFVPITHSQTLYQKLMAAGLPAQFVVVKNAGHNFMPTGGAISPSEAEIGRLVGDFSDKHLKA